MAIPGTRADKRCSFFLYSKDTGKGESPLLRRLLSVGGDQWGVIRVAFQEEERLKIGGRGGAEDTASRVSDS